MSRREESKEYSILEVEERTIQARSARIILCVFISSWMHEAWISLGTHDPFFNTTKHTSQSSIDCTAFMRPMKAS